VRTSGALVPDLIENDDEDAAGKALRSLLKTKAGAMCDLTAG